MNNIFCSISTSSRARLFVRSIILVFAILFFYQTVLIAEKEIISFLEQANEKFSKREDINELKSAIDIYKKILEIDNDNETAHVYLSRSYYLLGFQATDKKEKMKLYKKGWEYGDRAIEVNPDSAGGYYWSISNAGSWAELNGILSSLWMLPKIYRYTDKILKIDETYAWGGVHIILSSTYRQIPWFLGGDKNKAIEHAKKSKEIEPRCLRNQYFLAEAYLASGEEELAIKELRHIIDTPSNILNEVDFENKLVKAEVIKLLNRL